MCPYSKTENEGFIKLGNMVAITNLPHVSAWRLKRNMTAILEGWLRRRKNGFLGKRRGRGVVERLQSGGESSVMTREAASSLMSHPPVQ